MKEVRHWMPEGENTITPQPENGTENMGGERRNRYYKWRNERVKRKLNIMNTKNTTKAAEPRFMRSYYYFPTLQFSVLLDNTVFRGNVFPPPRHVHGYCSKCLNHISNNDVMVTVISLVTQAYMGK